MKLLKAFPLSLFLGTLLTLVSCEAPLVPRRVPFNDADFKATSGTGSGSVVGQGYVHMKDHTIKYPDEIQLVPVNAYTTEDIQRRYVKGENLAAGGPRYQRYIRTVSTDGVGHFTFHNIPPGKYYVGGTIEWRDFIWNTDNEGVMYKIWLDYWIPLYDKITVSNGQTVRISDWYYGKEQSE